MKRASSDPACRSRRAILALGTCVAGLFSFPRLALAEESPVPISLQVELLLKVAGYDRNLTERAAAHLKLLVLLKNEDSDSARSAAQAQLALSKTTDVLGLPLESTSAAFVDAPALARRVRAENVALLYLMPGFTDGDLAAIAEALAGVSVLSVGTLARYVARGTVLAFDLIGGKPKLLVNLARAKQQHVELSSSVLKLMRVIE